MHTAATISHSELIDSPRCSASPATAPAPTNATNDHAHPWMILLSMSLHLPSLPIARARRGGGPAAQGRHRPAMPTNIS